MLDLFLTSECRLSVYTCQLDLRLTYVHMYIYTYSKLNVFSLPPRRWAFVVSVHTYVCKCVYILHSECRYVRRVVNVTVTLTRDDKLRVILTRNYVHPR